MTIIQWPFQEPKLEVPTIYKAYFLGLCKGISPQKRPYMVQYLHFRILEFPLSYVKIAIEHDHRNSGFTH